MRFKQVVHRGNGKLAALDTMGKLWETQTDFVSRRALWRSIPDHDDMKLPILSISMQGERILAIDSNRVLWQQNAKTSGVISKGGLYEWRQLDMPIAED